MAKLNWGMIGGGKGSQIGPAHRLGARLDGAFAMVAGALDHSPEAGRAFAGELGIAEDRAYGDWREMLAGETTRDDRCDLVTVATPNATHFEITKAFLTGGVHVLCEKPMTMTVEEGEEIVKIARASGRICAVNYGYTGYYLVRHMRAMVARGEAELSPEADRTSRVTIGHAEGMPLAFANIYADMAEAITAEKQGRAIDPAANLYPRAEDGLRSMAAVHTAVASAKAGGAWMDARPPIFR